MRRCISEKSPQGVPKIAADPCGSSDRNWSSFQLAIIAHPLGVTCSDIAPSARINKRDRSWYVVIWMSLLGVTQRNRLNAYVTLSISCLWRCRKYDNVIITSYVDKTVYDLLIMWMKVVNSTVWSNWTLNRWPRANAEAASRNFAVGTPVRGPLPITAGGVQCPAPDNDGALLDPPRAPAR